MNLLGYVDVMSGRPLSRRHMLLGAGGGLLMGAGAAEVPAGAQTVPSDVIAPGESLMYEHGVLKRVLLIYAAADPMAESNPELAASAIHGGATIIHDFVENFHEALEESFVFPTLKKAHQLVSTPCCSSMGGDASLPNSSWPQPPPRPCPR